MGRGGSMPAWDRGGGSSSPCPAHPRRSAAMPPAARLTDLHTCPMQTPAVPPIPHVGGPVVGPGCPTVLIGGLPAAVLGDSTAHGGTIAVGFPTVMIGG
jgi:uncharacterized Zn-binding protein involved in type VI secretion